MAAKKKQSKDPVADLEKQIAKLSLQLDTARNKKVAAAKKAVATAESKLKKAKAQLSSLQTKATAAAQAAAWR